MSRLRVALVACGAVLAMAGCSVPQQVHWETYYSGLQARIDSAAASRDCTTLAKQRAAAEASSDSHRRATGFSNDALAGYIEDAQKAAGCPT